MQDFGKLLLRLCMGGLMLFHGIQKVTNSKASLEWIGSQLASHNLPDAIKWGVFAGEVLGPVLIVLGFLTRLGAVMVAVDMIAAVYLAKGVAALTAVNPQSGGWSVEIEAMYFLGSLAVLCLGSGRFALSGGRGRLN